MRVTLLRLGKHWLGGLFIYVLTVYLTFFVLFCLRWAARLNVDFMFYYNVFYCLLFNPVVP